MVLPLVLCLLFLGSGCVPASYRAHPEFDARLQQIKSTGLIQPDIKVYELSAGGMHELKDDWCSQGKTNVIRAIYANPNEKLTGRKTIELDKETEREIEDIQALYRAVSFSILHHTYNKHALFPEKQQRFDYSIGPVDKLLDKYGADALLFVYGSDEISTGGRKALQFVGLLTGIMPRSGITALSFAVVDRSGSVLWYNIKGGQGNFDLRDYNSVSQLVNSALSELRRSDK